MHRISRRHCLPKGLPLQLRLSGRGADPIRIAAALHRSISGLQQAQTSRMRWSASRRRADAKPRCNGPRNEHLLPVKISDNRGRSANSIRITPGSWCRRRWSRKPLLPIPISQVFPSARSIRAKPVDRPGAIRSAAAAQRSTSITVPSPLILPGRVMVLPRRCTGVPAMASRNGWMPL